jgi:hypothetical protein
LCFSELLNHGLCSLLNGIIFLQVLIYWNAKDKKDSAVEDKKDSAVEDKQKKQ